jgi:hypothetical protein
LCRLASLRETDLQVTSTSSHREKVASQRFPPIGDFLKSHPWVTLCEANLSPSIPEICGNTSSITWLSQKMNLASNSESERYIISNDVTDHF